MADKQSLNRRIAKNTLYLYVRMGVVLLVSLYTSRVVLRTLGVVDYGINNVVAGFVSMLMFLNTTMANSIQRFYNVALGKKDGASFRKVFSTAIWTQVILLIVIVLALETAGIWYLETKMVIPEDRMNAARIIFQFSLLSVCFGIMGVPFSGAVMANERMNYFAAVDVVSTFLRLGFVICLPHIPFDKLIVYGMFGLFVSILAFLAYFIYARLNFNGCRYEKINDLRFLKEMLGFSGWYSYAAFAGMLGNQGANMVLNLFFGPVVNAARGVAFNVNSSVMGFVGNVSAASRPQMIQSYSSGDLSRAMKLMYSTGKICFYACLIFVVPLVYEIKYVLEIWLGADAVPGNAASFTVMVLITSLISLLNGPVTGMVHAIGRIKKYHIITATYGLLMLPCSYILFKYGAPPITIFYLILFFVITGEIISLFIFRELLPVFTIKDYLHKVIVPVFGTALVSFAISFLFHNFFVEGFSRLLMVTLVSAAVTCLTSWFYGMDQSERDLVKNIYQSFKRRISGLK